MYSLKLSSGAVVGRMPLVRAVWKLRSCLVVVAVVRASDGKVVL